MAATLPILDAVCAHLVSNLPEYEVKLFPENPESHFLAHPNGAVLIAFAGSRFGKRLASDVIAQSREVHIVLTIQSRHLHHDNGALALLDKLRQLLTGFTPPHCSACWLEEEHFDGEESGIWQYQLVIQTQTMEVQDVASSTSTDATQATAAPVFRHLDPRYS